MRARFSISRVCLIAGWGIVTPGHGILLQVPPPAHIDKRLVERPVSTIKIDGPPESLHNSEIMSDDYGFIKPEKPFWKKTDFFFKKRGLANPNEKWSGTDKFISFLFQKMYMAA